MNKIRNRTAIDLTEGSISKQMILFSLPVLLTALLAQVYNLTDMLIVSNFIGAKALAAVGSTGNVLSFVSGFFLGFSSGAGVVISQFFGRKEMQSVHDAVHTSVMFSFIGGVFLSIFGVLATPALLHAMNTPDDVYGMAETYLRIVFSGLIFWLIFNMGAGILRAVGDSRRPLYYLAAGVSIHVVLAFVLIYFFDMGVAGAAIATTAGHGISATLVLISLFSARGEVRVYFRDLKIKKWIFGRIVSIGLPAGLQATVNSFTHILMQAQINIFGSVAMAGAVAFSRVSNFIYLPIDAISISISTFTSQNIGAGLYDRVKKGVRSSILWSVGYTIVAGALCILLRQQIFSLFLRDQAVIGYGIRMMWLFVPFYWIFVFTTVFANVCRGAGASMAPMIVTVAGLTVVRLAWIYAMMPQLKSIDAVFWSYPVSWLFTTICMTLYYFKGNWMGKFERSLAKTQN